jgi:hypothetical protein
MKILKFAVLFLALCSVAEAASQTRRASDAYNMAQAANREWLNPDNACDGVTGFSMVQMNHGELSDMWIGTGFDFDLPTGSTINAVHVNAVVTDSCQEPILNRAVVDLFSLWTLDIDPEIDTTEWGEMTTLGWTFSGTNLDPWLNEGALESNLFGVSFYCWSEDGDDETLGLLYDVSVTVDYTAP